MGHMQAEEMTRWADFETGLRWHLQSNHFPPIHLDFIEPAKRAIEIAREGESLWNSGFEEESREKYETEIELPNGKVRTVSQIIEGLHLEPWIQMEGEKDEVS